MTKILLTGGSGFIAAHILEQLLENGHSVVTTVRSEEKAQKIREAYKKDSSRLQVVVLPELAKEDAFDEVVKIPDLEVVMHTASPFHFKFTDAKTELVEPAVVGTTSLLKALQRSAPSVRRLIVTSSFAAIIDEAHFSDPSHTFTEKSWNPVTMADIDRSAATAYRLSKTMAERSAWDFVSDQNTRFDLVTVCPPGVFGPIVHHLAALENINTSNERMVAILRGQWKDRIVDGGPVPLFADVRDVARAHVKAMDSPEAGGHRLLPIGGEMSNRDIVEAVRARFPEYNEQLPGRDAPGGEKPSPMFKYNNDETNRVLDMEYIGVDKCVTDWVKSLKRHGI